MDKLRATWVVFLPALSACGVDPGDVTVYERGRIEEAVPVGSNYRAAAGSLERLGYTCATGSGSYANELGQSRSADAFIKCSGPTAPNELCKLGMSVVVLPSSDSVASVIFSSDYACH